jgi:hypothetical protein
MRNVARGIQEFLLHRKHFPMQKLLRAVVVDLMKMMVVEMLTVVRVVAIQAKMDKAIPIPTVKVARNQRAVRVA